MQKMWKTLALGPALSRHGWFLGSQLPWMILNVQENLFWQPEYHQMMRIFAKISYVAARWEM